MCTKSDVTSFDAAVLSGTSFASPLAAEQVAMDVLAERALAPVSERTVPTLLQGTDQVGGLVGDHGGARRRQLVEGLRRPQLGGVGNLLLTEDARL